MFGPCFVMQYFLFFLVLHHFAWEGRAGCFTVIVFLVACGSYCSVSFPHSVMG